MTTKQISRRNFAKALGQAAMLLPFIPRLGRAAETSALAKRVILFHTPAGVFGNFWTPLNATAPQAGQTVVLPQPAYNQMHAPLVAHKNSITLIEGLSFNDEAGNHGGGIAEGLTCGGRDSFDQFAARQFANQGIISRLPSLNLGVKVDYDGVFWRNGARISDLLNDPAAAFALLFPAQLADATQSARQLQRRLSILNAASSQLKTIQSGLGKVENNLIDAHLQGLSDLAKGLTKPLPATCTVPPAPLLAGNVMAQQNFPAVGKLQLDLIVNALACDLTRVAALQWTEETTDVVPAWIDASIGSSQIHADLSHRLGADAVPKLIKVEQWYASQYAYLLDALAARPEPTDPTSTLLDNTIVLWTRALGDGVMHTQHSVSYVLGGGSRALRQGSGGMHISYGGLEQLDGTYAPAPGRTTANGGWQSQSGQPHQRLFMTLAQALGIDATNFGLPSVNTGGKKVRPVLSELLK